MRRMAIFFGALGVLGIFISSFASVQITPTTTLAAEVANNTSAANSYNLTSSGNARPSNVSKHPMRSLLYGGSTTKILAQLQGWWGPSKHIQVGYWSNDPAQMKRQVNDAITRGIQGFILDWYGPTGAWPTNETALALKAEAEHHYGFTFAVQEDVGALWGCYNKSGCDVTGKLISDLKYAYYNFENSPAYQHIGGRPAVYLFDVNMVPIDWSRVRTSVPGNPLLIDRYRLDYNPYTTWFYDGAYAWPHVNTSNQYDWAATYLGSYYWAEKNVSKRDIGVTYKGFNDNLASWTQHRVMSQQCGATWINTWNKLNANYNSSVQLESVQIATWNDYEEGTEIETGIDPCLSMNASLSGSTLKFWPSGAGSEPRAVAYYTIFVSKDGQNLMKLTDVNAGIRSINLASYDFGVGEYYFYVKMQSKPGFHTRMSPVVKYAVNHIAVASPMPDGVTVSSPMHVVASATAANSPVKVMQIYLDGAKTYEVLNTSRLDHYLPAASGRWHQLTVQAYDANYARFYWQWKVYVR